jgi:hypothetical protein
MSLLKVIKEVFEAGITIIATALFCEILIGKLQDWALEKDLKEEALRKEWNKNDDDIDERGK